MRITVTTSIPPEDYDFVQQHGKKLNEYIALGVEVSKQEEIWGRKFDEQITKIATKIEQLSIELNELKKDKIIKEL